LIEAEMLSVEVVFFMYVGQVLCATQDAIANANEETKIRAAFFMFLNLLLQIYYFFVFRNKLRIAFF